MDSRSWWVCPECHSCWAGDDSSDHYEDCDGQPILVVPRAVAERLADELEHIVPAHAISAQTALVEYREAYPREETQ